MSTNDDSKVIVPSRFAARLAHEIRSPAGVFAGVLSEVADAPDGDHRVMLGLATRAVARLNRLARRLELMSEIEGPGLQPNRAPFDLAQSVRWAAEHVSDIRRRRVDVDVTAVPPEHRCLADSTLVGEAIVELVDNAIKHARRRVVVQLLISTEGGATILVEDDGPGLPSNSLQDLYRRGGRSGLGIGLCIAAAVARAHGGELRTGSADATPGARLEIDIPAAT
jgi:signal transduction histidine kinase